MKISPRTAKLLISIAIGLFVASIGPLALAESATYCGASFPNADRSFADRVVAYCAASCVRGAYGNPSKALGPPDCGDGDCSGGCVGCYGCDTCAVSLGFRVSALDNRGYLVLEFVDNRLIDVPGDDLFVYVTNDRPGLVEISADGVTFVAVGEVHEYPGAIDIAPFAAGEEEFQFVRISDVPADEERSTCPGPSIDAVGAMGLTQQVEPEPSEAFGALEVLPLGELAIAAETRPAESLLLILDTSSSMAESFEHASKLEVAKQVLLDLIEEIPDGTQVGFRSFGGCGNCQLLVPIGPINRAELRAKIQALASGGATSLAYALEQAKEDCAQIPGSKLLVLVSDGMETCGGDPIAAARDLVAPGYDLRVHIVGFDVAQYQFAREQLREIAEIAGGVYFEAGG